MKCLVIYDSIFGNTEKVAHAIGSALESSCEVDIVSVNKVNSIDTENLDLLIVGSPTRGFRPTKSISVLLRQLPDKGLKNIMVAAFDNRVRISDVNSAFLTFMVNLFGYAAQPIANELKSKGGNLAAHPEGFFVEDREGPLFIGELDRAQMWAKQLLVD
jgi:flavodoxin I